MATCKSQLLVSDLFTDTSTHNVYLNGTIDAQVEERKFDKKILVKINKTDIII